MKSEDIAVQEPEGKEPSNSIRRDFHLQSLLLSLSDSRSISQFTQHQKTDERRDETRQKNCIHSPFSPLSSKLSLIIFTVPSVDCDINSFQFVHSITCRPEQKVPNTHLIIQIMPPFTRHSSLKRRSDPAGKTFSIIFAVIALLVILLCLAWALILPKLRKESKNRQSRRVGNTQSSSPGESFHFPNHPAILRGFHKKQRPSLYQYNPLTESPFPPVGPLQAKPAAFITPRSSSNAEYQPGSGPGLFTPAKACLQPRQDTMLKQDKPLVSNGTAEDQPHIELTSYGHRHDHDYILPVPEPLVLKPRPAGRPPPLARQLERFPMPIGTLKWTDGLLHPAKLFQEMEPRDSQSTLDTVGTPCPAPLLVKRFKPQRDGRTQEKITPPEPSRASSDVLGLGNGFKDTIRQRNQWPGNSSIVIAKDEACQLQRVGKVTKPRTPVAKSRERFNQPSTVPTKDRTYVGERATPSANPFDTPGDWSTPPTSPPLPDSPMVFSRMRLLGQHACSPADAKQMGLGRRSSLVIFLSKEDRTPAEGIPSNLNNNAGRPSNRVIPPHLNLTLFPSRCGGERHAKEQSVSSLSTILRPILVPRSYRSHPASSMYSRDTKGMSLLRTPSNDRFSQYCAVQPSSYIDARNVMPMENVKSKIDGWDLHTAHLDMSAVNSTKLKRPLSDCGPRGPTSRDFDSITLVQALRVREHIDDDAKGWSCRMQPRRNSFDIFNKIVGESGTDHGEHRRNHRPPEDQKTELCVEFEPGDAPGGVAWI